MKNIAQAFNLAIKNIRSRLFHTFLSVLGIIIGVAALVSMLSLIDGLEKYAKEQIQNTTSLNTVGISASDFEVINDVRIKKDAVEKFDFQMIQAMLKEVDDVPRYQLTTSWNRQIDVDTQKIAAKVTAFAGYETDEERKKEQEEKMLFGSGISINDNQDKKAVAVINQAFADLVQENTEQLLGESVTIDEKSYTVKGIIESEANEAPTVRIPIGIFSVEQMKDKSPMFFAQAEDVTKLKQLQEQMKTWFETNYPEKTDDVKVEINEFRMEQLEKGFLIFRLIMGLIVGISVIVGGVGIMNVMLISIKERTPEIGIRKAIGAKQKDVLSQFLAESVFISLLGSFLGVVIGIAFTAAAVPIVNAIVKQTGEDGLLLQAAYTLNTILIIGVIAILIGVLFGTYPAIRASKLHPVDAIRRV